MPPEFIATLAVPLLLELQDGVEVEVTTNGSTIMEFVAVPPQELVTVQLIVPPVLYADPQLILIYPLFCENEAPVGTCHKYEASIPASGTVY